MASFSKIQHAVHSIASTAQVQIIAQSAKMAFIYKNKSKLALLTFVYPATKPVKLVLVQEFLNAFPAIIKSIFTLINIYALLLVQMGIMLMQMN